MASTPSGAAEVLDDPTKRRFRGSAKISEYDVMKEKLGEGTFGVVSKARSKRNGGLYALKKILMHNEKEGFPITALREVKLLKSLSHPNILHLEEMVVERHQAADDKGKSGKKRATLYTVTPYMDHDLSGMLNNPEIHMTIPQIKCYMMQLLEGCRYLHDSHILHRDMKAANILISNQGILQIADFGLARVYDGVVPQPGRGNGEAVRDYTSLVVTRWYRPPELLLTLKRYTPAIDLWGVGCVFAEMYEHKPILEGRTDVDQCVKIFQLLGNPTQDNMPGWDKLSGCEGRREWDRQPGNIDHRFRAMGTQGLDLLKKLLCLDWTKRINAIDALQHDFFKTDPLPARPSDIPRYEDSHELDNRRRGNQAKERNLPPAPAGGTVGMGPDEWAGGPYQNGYGYGGDRDRRPRGYDNRDRGPPGAHGAPPSRGYDDRREPRGPPIGGGREPAWRQADRSGLRPPPNGHQLPPRPEGLPARPEPVRAPPPAAAATGPAPPASRGSAVDTYIPSYHGGAQDYDRRPPPREYDRGRRNSRDDTYTPPRYRDADMPPRQYRDADVSGGRPGGRVDSYRERDHRGGPDFRRDDQRRTRSRSPERDRRARLQDRERELYRR